MNRWTRRGLIAAVIAGAGVAGILSRFGCVRNTVRSVIARSVEDEGAARAGYYT